MSAVYSVVRGARRRIRRCGSFLLCGLGAKDTSEGSDEYSPDLQTMTATFLQELRPARSDLCPSLGQDRLQPESRAVRRLRTAPKKAKSEDYDRVLDMECRSNFSSRYKESLARRRAQLANYLGSC